MRWPDRVNTSDESVVGVWCVRGDAFITTSFRVESKYCYNAIRKIYYEYSYDKEWVFNVAAQFESWIVGNISDNEGRYFEGVMMSWYIIDYNDNATYNKSNRLTKWYDKELNQ